LTCGVGLAQWALLSLDALIMSMVPWACTVFKLDGMNRWRRGIGGAAHRASGRFVRRERRFILQLRPLYICRYLDHRCMLVYDDRDM
jgi:hypothetical protein